MSEPRNAFSPAFLDLIHEADWFEYPISLEAGRWNGPWVVEPQGDRWQVRREDGDKVEADVELRETALMLAAILPIAFLPPIYGLRPGQDKDDDLSWELMAIRGDRGFCSVGRLDYGHDEIPCPLHVVHGLLTHPASLAFLLQAAPPEVLAQAGEILARRCQARQP